MLDEPFGAFDPLQLDDVLPAVRGALGEAGIALVRFIRSIAERLADRIVMLAADVSSRRTLDELRARAGATALRSKRSSARSSERRSTMWRRELAIAFGARVTWVAAAVAALVVGHGFVLAIDLYSAASAPR